MTKDEQIRELQERCACLEEQVRESQTRRAALFGAVWEAQRLNMFLIGTKGGTDLSAYPGLLSESSAVPSVRPAASP